MPVVVVALVAVLAGCVCALVVWRFPAADPAAPRLASPTVAEATDVPVVRSFLAQRLDPEAVTGLLLTAALLLVLAGAIAIGALFVMERHNALLAHYDLSAARWGAQHATSASTQTLRQISQFGGTPMMVGIALGVAIVEFLRTRVVAVFGFMLAVVLGQVVLTNLTKVVVNRPRPDIARLTGFSGASFPSGHAATAAATFAAAAFLVGRGRPHAAKVVLAAIAAAIAAGVATTRVFLGVHWLTDVLAGLALGWGWFALCSIAFGGRILRFGQPVAVAQSVAAASTAPDG